jgi:predicted RND superfamily exporter protein
VVLLAVAVIGANRVVVGDLQEGSPLFWADSEVNIADNIINTNFFGTSPYLIFIKGDREEAGVTAVLSIPEVVREVNALADHLEKRADVSGAVTYTDVIKALSRAYHDNDPRFYFLPTHRAMNYEFLLKFTEGGGPEDAQAYFEMDFGDGNILVYVRNHAAPTIRGIIKDTEEWIAQNHNPDLPIEIQPAAGLIGIFSAIMDTIKKGQRDSLFLISGVIFLFVLIAFRSPICGLLVIAVLGLGTLITFATMGHLYHQPDAGRADCRQEP